MNIIHALFNPNGVLPANKTYWMGAGILIVVAAVLQYLSYQFVISADDMSGLMQSSAFSMLLWLLIYPYFCLYGKRLRDMGQPATWFLLILGIYVVANWIVQAMITMPAMMGEMQGMVDQMQDISQTEEGEAPDFNSMMNAQMEMQKSMIKKIMWPSLIAGAIVSAIISGVMGSFKSKSEDNPFRPPATVFE